MMKKFYIVMVMLFGIVAIATAQDKVKFSGVVVTEKGEPVIGANVGIKGTYLGAITDGQGAFSVQTKPGSILIFSMVGYAAREIEVGKATERVVLKEDLMKLADVVVTGYSKQERRDILGSVATIKPRETHNNRSVDQMLQGQVAGVMMSNSSGALGAANMISIRGISSSKGDNNPLWVIDGVPVFGTGREDNLTSTSGGSTPGMGYTGTNVSSTISNDNNLKYGFEKNPLATLNPDDIESIEILKDAFSTAIYGSRGASGVILVTTKKGVRDRTKVNVNYSFSAENPLAKLDLLNGQEYNMLYSMYYPNSPFTSKSNTDWLDQVTRTAYSHNVSASVSGGTDKTVYFISASASDAESYIINNDMQRYSARVNVDSRLGKFASIGTNITISQLNNGAIAAPNIYGMAARKAPNIPVYDDRDNYFYGQGTNPYGSNENYNPVAMARDNEENSLDYRVTGNVYVDIRPTDWITFRSDIGLDNYNSKTSVRKADVPLSDVIKNQAQESVSLRNRFVITNTLNMTRLIHEHFIQCIIGQSYETSRNYSNSIVGQEFFSAEQSGVGAAQTKTVSGGGEIKSALFSVFARANYQYKSRYMLGATYRIDGSSAYNKDNRYLSTPSVSVGWRISNEPFVRRNMSWIDDLKIRASFGLSSKDGNPNYYGSQTIYTINTASYAGSQFLNISQPGNSKLDWEKSKTYDVGLDLSLFEKRIDLTVDYYYKKTTNMLFNAELPGYTGFSTQSQNIGDQRDSGIEVKITSVNINTRNFQWLSTLTFGHNSNKLLKLNYTGAQSDYLNNGYKYYEVGYPLAQFYLHKWGGVNPTNGNPLWVYKDGSLSEIAPASNNTTSNANKFICGSGLPTLFGGFNSTFIYKNLELDLFINFSFGGKMINNTKAELMTYTTKSANNLHRDALKFWQIYGHQTEVPSLKNNSITSNYDYTTSSTTDRFLEDNSYVRLKNIELAYNLPIKKKSSIFKQVRIYGSVSNVFTITKYSGIDPEVSAYGSSLTGAGYDQFTMPQSRSYQLGIKIGF